MLINLLQRDWLRGETPIMVVECREPIQGRYRVRGLDEDGNPAEPNAALRVMDAFTDDPDRTGEWTVVAGDHPACVAVRFFRGLGSHLVLTPTRLGLVEVKDAAAADVLGEFQVEQKSFGGLMKGVGKLVKGAATELVNSARRPPLEERPQDARLHIGYEGARADIVGAQPWKPPLMPELKHGPRLVEMHFRDRSWVRFETSAADAPVLTG